MQNLNRMMMFAAVVEAQSFSKAAKSIGVGKSAVSMQINRLEEELGVRLLNRTTRQLSLTEAGSHYYQSCARIGEEILLANEQIRSFKNEVSGTLRVSCPVGFGNRVLIPILSDFMSRYPDVKLDLDLNDENVSLAGEGVDVSIRMAELADSSLIAAPLARIQFVLVAAPAYVEQHGTPTRPEELNRHSWVLFPHLPTRIPYEHDGRMYLIDTDGRIKVNNEMARHNLVMAGHGIAFVPLYSVWQQLQMGELIELLAEYPFPTTPVTALYQNRKFLPKKVTVFIQYVREKMAEQVWNQGGNE